MLRKPMSLDPADVGYTRALEQEIQPRDASDYLSSRRDAALMQLGIGLLLGLITCIC
jgi:hypothetical protein